jgi:replicative DNA helicase
MVTTAAEQELLRERLLVWKGPLPFLLSDKDGHRQLRELVLRREVGTVFVDSLKDVAVKLSDDEVGGRVNLAFQAVISEGVELCAGHHQRKATADNRRPNTLADVYGSNWLTAGMGSVLLLWGEPGDPVVELRHLKQPAEEVGPFNVLHDHERGLSTLHEPPELAAMLYDRGAEGMTVNEAAEALFGPSPSKAQIEKTRRKLKAEPLALEIPSAALGEPARFVHSGGKERG